ncbi:MAG: LacI family transcriptional regulator [Ardenticatenaceae bacterium]|nr:LacI family transcriptional regulator [Ardenticatenaceae bacterium]
MTRTRPTITDVARHAGVSVATVSRVLNNNASVGDDFRAKVLAAIEALHFRPSPLAQNLRRYAPATRLIGAIVPSLRSPHFVEVVIGIQEFCYEREYGVVICNAHGDPEQELFYASELERQGVEGIIFTGAWGWDMIDHIEALVEKKIPVCVINRPIGQLAVDLVMVGRRQGNYLATGHLLNLGHRSIGHITTRYSGSTAREAASGYRKALVEAGLAVDESLIVEAEPTPEGGYEAAHILLGRSPPPTAIAARSDLTALGVLRAASEMGLRLPDDLSVVGFDDAPFAQFTNPPLTTIRQPQAEMGAHAAALLLERLANPDLPQRQVILEPRLIIRGSTAKYQPLPAATALA